MATIFPGSASVGQIFDGYEFNGTAWDIIGIDLTADYLESSTASSTYLTQVSASTTYQIKVENVDNTEIGYLNNASANIQTQLNSKANLSGATFSGNIIAPEVRATTKLVAQTVGGDEGGEILLGKAATNTTLTGDGVTIDVWQNRLRIFEQGGDARGAYLDITKLSNGVASPISTIDSGSTVKTFSIKENQTQAVYGSAGYNFYNQAYTTNSKVSSKLLITFGVAYELNTASDSIQLAVSLNGTDEFTFNDTGNSVIYNDMPFYTFISTNSYYPSTTISNLRVYIKSISGTVVCPRSAGTLHNFFLTVQEIAV